MASKKDPTRFSGKFKKGVDSKVLEWMELQDNFSDAVAYLIEKEIAENGIRNLVNFIPQKRSKEYFKSILGEKNEVGYVRVTELESIKNIKDISLDKALSNSKELKDTKEVIEDPKVDDDENIVDNDEGNEFNTDQDLSAYGL